MNAKAIFLTLTAVATLGALGFALKEHSTCGETERLLADRQQQRGRLESEIRQAGQRLAELEREREHTQAALDATRKKAPSRGAPASPAAQPVTALRNAILNDPHLQNLQLAVAQSKLMGTYRPLCEQLNLAPAQTEQFLAILRKRGEQQMDLSAIRETQRSQPDDPVFATLDRQMKDEFRAAQTSLLGEAGYRQLETYERTVPVRELLNEFAGAAAVAGYGLSVDQADALTQAVIAASASYQRGGLATRENIGWDQAFDKAAAILSPPQFAVLKNAVLQFRNMDRLRELARVR